MRSKQYKVNATVLGVVGSTGPAWDRRPPEYSDRLAHPIRKKQNIRTFDHNSGNCCSHLLYVYNRRLSFLSARRRGQNLHGEAWLATRLNTSTSGCITNRRVAERVG